jgi:hypothetical protein
VPSFEWAAATDPLDAATLSAIAPKFNTSGANRRLWRERSQ